MKNEITTLDEFADELTALINRTSIKQGEIIGMLEIAKISVMLPKQFMVDYLKKHKGD